MVLAEAGQPFHQLSQRGHVVAFVVQRRRDHGKPKMPLFGKEQDVLFPHRSVQRRLRTGQILKQIPKGPRVHDGAAQSMGSDLLSLLHHQQELLTQGRTRPDPFRHFTVMPAHQARQVERGTQASRSRTDEENVHLQLFPLHHCSLFNPDGARPLPGRPVRS